MIRRWLPYILSCLFMIGSFFAINVQVDSWNQQIDEQTSSIADLENQITIKKAAQEKTQNIVVSESMGLDASRTMNDDKLAAEFIKKCLTWSTYDEYTSIRNSIIEDYGVKEDSNFLTVFMPEIINATSPDGTEYNYIDTLGYNLSYEKMESYVTNISDDKKYSYFTFVTVSSQSKEGYEGTTTAAFMYTIDVDGNITDIDASAVS